MRVSSFGISRASSDTVSCTLEAAVAKAVAMLSTQLALYKKQTLFDLNLLHLTATTRTETSPTLYFLKENLSLIHNKPPKMVILY